MLRRTWLWVVPVLYISTPIQASDLPLPDESILRRWHSMPNLRGHIVNNYSSEEEASRSILWKEDAIDEESQSHSSTWVWAKETAASIHSTDNESDCSSASEGE